MNENFSSIPWYLQLVVALVQALSWPLTAIFIVLLFQSPVRRFLETMTEFRIKAGDFEASGKKELIEASVALGAAFAESRREGEGEGKRTIVASKSRDIVGVIVRNVTPATLQKLTGATLLWADDQPTKNEYLRKAFEALGMRITVSMTVAEMVEKVTANRYDVAIANMELGHEDDAGYTILDEIRNEVSTTPYVIYAPVQTAITHVEARRRGAVGAAGVPEDLFEMVVDAVGKR